MNFDLKLVREDSVRGKRRLSVHYTYWLDCECAASRKHFYIYTEDKDFDVLKYIKENHINIQNGIKN